MTTMPGSERTNVQDRFRLDNRVVVVTGGAGFLGRQHAEAIIESRGVPVLLDVDANRLSDAAADLTRTHGLTPLTISCDITDEGEITRAIDAIVEKYGRLDAVVNNAQYPGRQKHGPRYFAAIHDYPIDAWRQAIEVNLTGTFIVTKAALRPMVVQKRGVLVNIASDVGVISPDGRIYDGLAPDKYFNTPPSYSAAKAAVISFTRHLATHYAAHGIRANAISPAGMFNNQPQEFVERLTTRIPLARMAERGEYKAAIVFLLSDASSFMTGANLIVDGGRTAW